MEQSGRDQPQSVTLGIEGIYGDQGIPGKDGIDGKPTDEQMGQTYVETWEDDGTFVTQKWIIQEVDLDVLKELKTAEISTMCAETIGKGIDVMLCSLDFGSFSLRSVFLY